MLGDQKKTGALTAPVAVVNATALSYVVPPPVPDHVQTLVAGGISGAWRHNASCACHRRLQGRGRKSWPRVKSARIQLVIAGQLRTVNIAVSIVTMREIQLSYPATAGTRAVRRISRKTHRRVSLPRACLPG